MLKVHTLALKWLFQEAFHTVVKPTRCKFQPPYARGFFSPETSYWFAIILLVLLSFICAFPMFVFQLMSYTVTATKKISIHSLVHELQPKRM